MKFQKGLLIRQPWIDLILNGEKTWEIRSSKTKIRGTIGLIQSATGLITGQVDLVGCTDVLSAKDLNKNRKLHQIQEQFSDSYQDDEYMFNMPYGGRAYAWIFLNAQRLKKPIPYTHPQGAVIWVNLENT
jgi:hypothetical protein